MVPWHARHPHGAHTTPHGAHTTPSSARAGGRRPTGLSRREAGFAACHPPARCVQKRETLPARRVACVTVTQWGLAAGFGPPTAGRWGGPGLCPGQDGAPRAPAPELLLPWEQVRLRRVRSPGGGRSAQGGEAGDAGHADWRPPPGGSGTRRSSDGEETRTDRGKASRVPWHLGQGGCGAVHSVLYPSIPGGRHRVRVSWLGAPAGGALARLGLLRWSAEQSWCYPWAARHVCPSCTCQGLPCGAPWLAREGAGQDVLPSGPKAPERRAPGEAHSSPASGPGRAGVS